MNMMIYITSFDRIVHCQFNTKFVFLAIVYSLQLTESGPNLARNAR